MKPSNLLAQLRGPATALALSTFALVGCVTHQTTTTSAAKPPATTQAAPPAQAVAPSGSGDVQEFSIVWFQQSAEARALFLQGYNLARLRLDAALASRPAGSRPPAIITDIDETVIDNSPWQATAMINGWSYPQGYKEFIASGRTTTLPGAADFLHYAKSRGVSVFYVTNRSADERDATLADIRRLALPDADDAHLLTRGGPSTKEPRRTSVAASHDILLLLGDNLGDFDAAFDTRDAATRSKAVDTLAAQFGSRFIVFPNPMYGDWEGTLYGGNWKLTPAERQARRRDSLRRY